MSQALAPRILLAGERAEELDRWACLIERGHSMRCFVCRGWSAARAAVELGPLDGALVDGRDDPDEALRLLHRLRVRAPWVGLAMVARSARPGSLGNRATSIGVFLVGEPFGPEVLDHWARLAREALRRRTAVMEVIPGARSLSRRETQCLELALCGLSTADVAVQLRISDSSARTYLTRALSKLGVRRVGELHLGTWRPFEGDDP